MSTVPLDVERKCEQRWAARRKQPVLAGASQRHCSENSIESPAGHTKAEQEAADLNPSVRETGIIVAS